MSILYFNKLLIIYLLYQNTIKIYDNTNYYIYHGVKRKAGSSYEEKDKDDQKEKKEDKKGTKILMIYVYML